MSNSTLVYVDDSLPGIMRRRFRGKWAYFLPDGARITDRREIDRLNRVGLPPAYTDCWFCPADNGHILATGYDARGRKQYRYHPDFRNEREAEKFDGCARFGRLLPLVRQRVAGDVNSRGLTRERAIASVVRLLDTGGIRIGNEHYARTNSSFGATTLRMRHVRVSGERLKLRFRAKSGLLREMQITDRSLSRFVKAMGDLPGQQLFQYLDDDGEPQPVSSTDVNAYIRETMGADFTAKHFRTWRASAVAFDALIRPPTGFSLTMLVELVASSLGNTPAIARKSYIHPSIIALAQSDHEAFRKAMRLPRATRWMTRTERALVEHLESAGGIGPATG
jgi:DNA topoisomerase-1